MTIGAAIFIVALGAIFRYAISDSIEGIDLQTIGLILMIAGVAGIILEFIRQGMWRNRRRDPDVVERERVRDRP
jgi:hypothetical protein